MEAICRPGFNYAKAAVALLDIYAGGATLQSELALNESDANRPGLMAAIDGLNERFGQGSVSQAGAGLAGDRRSWMMKQNFTIPNYTRHWADMPVARA